MSDTIRKFAPIAVILVLLAAGVVWVLNSGSGSKTLTAYFPRTVSVYEGSDVRVLGVPVGQVDTVEPEGTKVKVTMHYDSDVDLPEDAKAVIISPSVVGDRYIQVAPAFKDGDKALPDNSVLQTDRTAVPLELDQIYGSIDNLATALGPNGANSKGALTDLLEQTARNFGGQGAKFKQTIQNFGDLSATLDDNKTALFSSARKLQQFIHTLATNDTTVRDFNTSLGNVSRLLDSERQDLTSALSNLGVALDEVGGFVKDNRDALTADISGLGRVAHIIAQRRSELSEVLSAGPLALNNLALAYDPQTGTLNSNANVGNLLKQSPSELLCALVSANDPGGKLCGLFDHILPRTGPFTAGSGSWSKAAYDPSLNGLVEVKR